MRAQWHVYGCLVIIVLAGCEDAKNSASNKDRSAAMSQIRYENSSRGLKNLMTDVLRATGTRNDSLSGSLYRSLELMESNAWFSAHFGPDDAQRLSSQYTEVAGRFGQLRALFSQLNRSKRTQIEVTRHTQKQSAAANGHQRAALRQMIKPVPLYSVRFLAVGEQHGYHMWSFVHHQGSFRWAGMMKLSPPPTNGVDPKELAPKDLQRAKK